MTYGAELFMAEDSHVLQERLSEFLRSRLPAIGGPDALARLLNIAPRTARNYLDQHWPGARQWRAIVRAFGRDVLAAVYEPEIDDVKARLAAKIRAKEVELANDKAAFRALVGAETGVAPYADG